MALLALPATAQEESADLIVEGRIFTADRERPWVEALAVRGELVVAAGTRGEVARLRGERTRVLSADPGVVVPGFNDAHGHFSVAHGLGDDVELDSARTLEEILARLRAHVAAHPEDELVSGHGWNLARMEGDSFPTAAMLDAAVDDRPVLLWSEGPHAVWANSAALERARIDDGTPEPRGVIFLRDAQGNPSGVFLGRGLFGLFRFAPPPELEGMRAGIVAGLAEARALGVTSIQEQVSPLLLPFLCELRERGELTLRFHVWGTLFAGPFGGGAQEHLANRKAHERADWITFGTLKGGVDGMPSLRTAALLEPYADDPSTRGLPLGDTERLVAAVKDAHARGLRVALHATGDAGVRLALDAFQAARQDGIRDRIEHAFFVTPEDVARAAQVGAIVSVQPGFLLRDLELDLYAKRLGQERLGRVLPLRSLLDAGATLAFGTDFSLTPLDPRLGLQAAVVRASAAGSASGFVPAERISLEEAVRAYTYGSAQAEGAGERKGRLLPGMLADFVLLSRDVFAEPARLLEAEVRVTVVDGRIVHER